MIPDVDAAHPRLVRSRARRQARRLDPDRPQRAAQRGRAVLRFSGRANKLPTSAARCCIRTAAWSPHPDAGAKAASRPALAAVVFRLPPLLFVPEAAHAGNTDRSPFRAHHRSSPVFASSAERTGTRPEPFRFVALA